MEESNSQLPEWESPLNKLWDILMFRTFILSSLLKTLNLLALLFAIVMTVVYLYTGLLLALAIVWMYVIALRIVSELVLLCNDFLVQRTQIKE
jgi:hypothetical protein